MKKLFIAVLAFGVNLAYAGDGFTHLKMKVNISGYSEAPSSIWLHNTNIKREQFECDESLVNSYHCVAEVEVPVVFLDNLRLDISGGFKTTTINSTVSLICDDAREIQINEVPFSKMKKDGARGNALITEVRVKDAYYECSRD